MMFGQQVPIVESIPTYNDISSYGYYGKNTRRIAFACTKPIYVIRVSTGLYNSVTGSTSTVAGERYLFYEIDNNPATTYIVFDNGDNSLTYSPWYIREYSYNGGIYRLQNGAELDDVQEHLIDGIYNQSHIFTTFDEILANEPIVASNGYPITYHSTNSVVTGPEQALVGETVTVSAVPDVGYGITDTTTQIIVTNDDVAVPYTWDASNNRITFTMPQPAENRGGFGNAV